MLSENRQTFNTKQICYDEPCVKNLSVRNLGHIDSATKDKP